MSVDWRSVGITIISTVALLWAINELLFETYMPKDKSRASHIQMEVNRLRDLVEVLELEDRTPEEEARLRELEEKLNRLRQSRDQVLGLQ